jgi:hypothetical protein
MIDAIVMLATAFIVYKEAWWQGYGAGTEDFIIELEKKEEHSLNYQREQE